MKCESENVGEGREWEVEKWKIKESGLEHLGGVSCCNSDT